MAFTTLRPQGVVYSGNVGVSPNGSNAAANLRDGSDTTYSRIADTLGSSGEYWFSLQTLALPPLAQIRQVRVVTRLMIIGSPGNTAHYRQILRNSSGTEQTGGDGIDVVIPGNGNAGVYDLVGAWRTTAPDGGAWTEAKVNGALLVLRETNGGGSEMIYEAYVDVQWDYAPTTALTAPVEGTTFTDNAKPSFSWTYADTEASAQDKWRLLVFDEPQVDPEGNAAESVADSGVVTSTVTTWTPTGLLPDGNLYAYFHASDAGSNGRYSAWSVVSFVVNCNAPTVAVSQPAYGAKVTATDKPTFSWIFDDPGGPEQDRWQVLVFGSQVNDPTASAGSAILASGEIFSSAHSWSPSTALPNGDYWVYVRAGNSSVPAGRYSAWSGAPFKLSVAPPSVAFTTPASNAIVTDSNRPTFAWSFTSPLKYAQERWQILVFTTGQNDPGANAIDAVLNSAEQFGSERTWTPTKGIANGTYFAYIRVADVGSSGRYSSWASVTFRVDALPSAIPVLRLDSTLIDFPATAGVPSVAIHALTSENALDPQTSNFETTVGSWVADLNATVDRVASPTTARKGDALGRMTATADGPMRARTGTFAVAPSRYVTAGAWVRPSTIARENTLTITWYSGANVLGTVSGPGYVSHLGTWVQIEAIGTAPVGTTHAAITWAVDGAVATEAHLIDCVYLRTTPNPTAGTEVDDPNFIWPANLFALPAFQSDLLPTDSASPWRVINTVDEEADPEFWHAGATDIPAVSAPLSTLTLDLAGLPALRAAWSAVRRLKRAYAGSAIEVVRLSDGEAINIGFTPAGEVDWGAVTLHCGTSIGLLRRIYDQSGNGFDLVQTDTAHMFRIYDGTSPYTTGNKNRPCLYAEDAVRAMTTGAFTSFTGSKVSAIVVGAIPSGGGGGTAGKTENVVDDFSSQNTALWNGYDGNPSIVSGQLNITPTHSYEAISTVATYDFTGSYFRMEIIQRPNGGNGSVEGSMIVSRDSSNQFAMIVAGGNLVCRERASGTNSDTTVTWNATTMKFWRLRESSGTAYWETSSDGATWTTRRSKTIALGAITAMRCVISAGYWGTETSPGVFKVDSVGITGAEGAAPRMLSMYGAAASDSTGTQGAVLVGRDGTSAAVSIQRNGATRASRAITFGSTAMYETIIDETADSYKTGADGTVTTGATANIGAFAATNLAVGYTGSAYASVQGMKWSECYVFDDALTTSQANIVQGDISEYFGTPPVPVSTGGGTGGGSGGTSPNVDQRFVLVYSDDLTSSRLNEWNIYDFGKATQGYHVNSWMKRNATYNAAGKYYDLKAWKNGTYREGVGMYLNMPIAIGKSMAWEMEYSTDDVAWMSPVALTWPDGKQTWPLDAEIDFWEIFNGGSKLSCGKVFFHKDTVAGSSRALFGPSSGTHSSSPDISRGNFGVNMTQRHTIRVELISGVSIKVYCDGVLRAWTTDTSYVPSTLAHRLTLQQEFYGYSDNNVPAGAVAHTRIYAVRAYEFRP